MWGLIVWGRQASQMMQSLPMVYEYNRGARPLTASQRHRHWLNMHTHLPAAGAVNVGCVWCAPWRPECGNGGVLL